MIKYWDSIWRKWTIWKNWYVYISKNWKRHILHRFVYEEYIWRKLLDTEHIHHKNWIKTDNRLENLELLSRTEHLSFHSKENNLWKDRLWISPANKYWIDFINKIISMYKWWKWRIAISKELNISPTTVYKYTTNII